MKPFKQTEFHNFAFFSQHSQALYDVLQKKIENLELIQSENFESIDHSESCITVKVSPKTQKIEICLANEVSVWRFFSTEQRVICRGNVGNELAVMLKRKGPHIPEFAHDIVCIHFLMIDTGLIKDSFVGDTKFPVLRCFRFISELKAGHNTIFGQYMSYLTFSNLQFRQLLNVTSHSIHIDFRDTRGEKIPFPCVFITCLVLILRKASNIHF